jgi:imidazolonepropionase-like amidohydrolase
VKTLAALLLLCSSSAKLTAAGARIVLGGDTGLQDDPFGFAEHRELELMVEEGMTPMQAIVVATSRGADYLRLRDTGVLAMGKRADFIVLDGNPLGRHHEHKANHAGFLERPRG